MATPEEKKPHPYHMLKYTINSYQMRGLAKYWLLLKLVNYFFQVVIYFSLSYLCRVHNCNITLTAAIAKMSITGTKTDHVMTSHTITFFCDDDDDDDDDSISCWISLLRMQQANFLQRSIRNRTADRWQSKLYNYFVSLVQNFWQILLF